jgi:hypothetical protein
MRIPIVIDNQTYRLADILNALLAEQRQADQLMLPLPVSP